MSLLLKIICLSVVVLYPFSPTVYASTDEFKLAVDEMLSPQLRWDNLSGEDEWLVGPQPVKNKGQFQVVLQPQQSISILQPANSWLRLESLEFLNSQQALQIEQSVDGQVFISGLLHFNQQQALLKPMSQTYIARLQNNSEKPLALALYRSRVFLNSPQLKYKDSIPLSLKSIDLQISPDEGLQRYYILPAMKSVDIQVKGPRRIAIHCRRPLKNQSLPAGESRIKLFLDNRPLSSQDIYFKEDYHHTIRAAGKRIVVSEMQTLYVNVPEGHHQLNLQTASHLYFQMRSLGKLYWLEGNLPVTSRWINDPTNIKTTKQGLAQLERRLLARSRDNKRTDGALEALAELETIINKADVKAGAFEQVLLQIQKKIKQRYTYFEPVLPVPSVAPYIQRSLRYLKDSLQFRTDQKIFYLAQQFFQPRLQQISEQSFYELKNNPLEYGFSATGYPSELQLLFYNEHKSQKQITAPAKIWIQIDEQPAQQIKLRYLPETEKIIHQPVTRHVLQKQACCTSLLGKLAVKKGSADLVRVASLQLPLSVAARHFKIWQQEDQPPLWVALQQRRGAIYHLSETQYRDQLHTGNGFERFKQALHAYTASNVKTPQKDINVAVDLQAEPHAQSQTELWGSHWRPLIKQMHGAYQTRLKNIKLFKPGDRQSLSKEEVNAIQNRGLKAQQSQQWVLALQHWSRLWMNESAEVQKIALQHIINDLQQTGQHSLARQLQLSIVFSTLATDFVESQLQQLLNDYQQLGNADAQVALLFAVFVHRPDLKYLQQLALTLVAQGRWQQGLELLLLLPESQQQLPTVQQSILLSALQTGWLNVFDEQLLKAKLSTTKNNKWLGLKALISQRDTLALKYLKAANPETDEQVKLWLSVLQRSQQLQSQLLSNDRNEREAALKKWQKLQLKINTDLSSVWRTETASVISHAGQVAVKNLSTDVSLMHYLSRSENQQATPFELQIAGPVKLRLDIRPLHKIAQQPSGKVEAMNSAFQIRSGDQQLNILINHNLPSENWRVKNAFILEKKSSQKIIPGQRLTHELNLGAGLHRLSIVAKEDLLIRLHKQYNPLPVSVLPQISAQNMALILHNTPPAAAKDRGLTLSDEMIKAWSSKDKWLDKTTPLQSLQSLALQLQKPSTKPPTKPAELIAAAEKLYADNHYAQPLTATLSRLRQYTRWDVLNSVEQSDGFWVQRYNSWRADSPQSRIFQALMPALESLHGKADEILRTASTQVVSVFNPQSSQLQMQLWAISPLFISTQSVGISYQVDNNDVQYRSVSAAGESISLALSSGRHNIKISVLRAPLQHRLGLSLKEANGQRVSLQKSRRYQLASPQQPLVYNLQGPAWLRVDKYIKDQAGGDFTQSEYRYYSAGQQRLTLKVDPGEQSGFYRVFQRRENPAIQAPRAVSWEDRFELQATAQKSSRYLPEHLSLAHTPRKYTLHDGWNLGRQQTGTTSLLLTRVDQNLIIDELSVSSDQYLETELAYRKLDSMSRRWFYLAGLARLRQQGNPTAGVKSRLRGQFARLPIDWTVDGRAYAQQLESGLESSVQLQARLSQTRWLGSYFYHLPRLDVFARWLSANSEAGNSNIDRDVYSDYKKDHPSGLRLSETLVYRPYEDMELYTGLTLVSNANWQDLDQTRSRVGARLQWGNLRWDINARHLQFMADEDRLQDSARSVIQGRVLLEKWLYPRYRLELAAALDHDIDSGDDTVRVQLSVHQSEGRGYLDFSPAETLFRNVRQGKLNLGLHNEFN